jgi:uncharacterized protein YdeI (YjbR/CyaY-like superfamily)
MAPELPIETFASARTLAAWLARHHGASTGVWLKLAKKRNGTPSVSYAEALEVALTYGWIDGQKRPLDADWWLQKLTPRGVRSAWSKINRDKAEALIAAGKMKPSGQREIDRAKTDGRWAQAYDSHRTSTVPDDLARALIANKRAAAFFEIIDAANRYAILYRVQTAKKPETRADRIARLVAMLAKKETLHPLKKKR